MTTNFSYFKVWYFSLYIYIIISIYWNIQIRVSKLFSFSFH